MYSAVRTFSETKARDRQELGERITKWIRDEKPIIIDTKVCQSSDHEFHCLSVVIFYKEGGDQTETEPISCTRRRCHGDRGQW